MPNPNAVASPRPPVTTMSRTAEELCVSVRTVQRLIGEDELKTVRIGRAVRVTRESIDALIARGGTAR